MTMLVAIAMNEGGFREALGTANGMKEDKASWISFFQWRRGCGLDGVKLIVGDKCMGTQGCLQTPNTSGAPSIFTEVFLH